MDGCSTKDPESTPNNLGGASSSHPDDYSKLIESIQVYLRRILGADYETVGEDFTAALQDVEGKERTEFLKLIGKVQKEIEEKSAFSVQHQTKFIHQLGPGDFSEKVVQLLVASRLRRLARDSPDPESAKIYRNDAAIATLGIHPDVHFKEKPMIMFNRSVQVCEAIVEKKEGRDAPSVHFCGNFALKTVMADMMIELMFNRFHVPLLRIKELSSQIILEFVGSTIRPEFYKAAEALGELYTRLLEKTSETSRRKSLMKHKRIIELELFGSEALSPKNSVDSNRSGSISLEDNENVN